MRDKLVIIGAGGHARSVADVAVAQGLYDIIGCISNEQNKELGAYGLRVIGDDDSLPDILASGVSKAFVAIGDNKLRAKIYKKISMMGFQHANILSPYAVISPLAKLGQGICVMHGAVVHVNVLVGSNSIINTKASIDHDCVIGKHCHIAPGVTLSGSVTVGTGVHIGTGSSVIDSIEIGAWSYLGAGSVIVQNIEENKLVYGVPGKNIRNL